MYFYLILHFGGPASKFLEIMISKGVTASYLSKIQNTYGKLCTSQRLRLWL